MVSDPTSTALPVPVPRLEAPTPRTPKQPITIVILITEPSGDVLGASLIAALRELSPQPLSLTGIAGPLMQAEGCTSLFPMSDLSLMGLTEILPHLPRLLRRIRETVAHVQATRPAVVVTIDGPGFNLRVARALRQAGYTGKLVHVVAPSVWAWKPGRAAKLATLYDHLLALLPFEPPYFTPHGLATTFIGHPIVDCGADRGDGAAFRIRHGMAVTTPLLAVLPGSRRGEVSRLLPIFAATVSRLAAEHPGLQVALPVVPHLADLLAQATARWPVPVHLIVQSEKYDLMAASTAALAASGTVTLELALAGVPAVVAYRVHPLTAAIVRRLIKVKYAGLVNLLQDREILPEFIQAACTPAMLAPAVGRFLRDEGVAEYRAGCQAALAQLRPDRGETPARTAAAVVVQFITTLA
jgi:lipid-A-disaccharide synthase